MPNDLPSLLDGAGPNKYFNSLIYHLKKQVNLKTYRQNVPGQHKLQNINPRQNLLHDPESIVNISP